MSIKRSRYTDCEDCWNSQDAFCIQVGNTRVCALSGDGEFRIFTDDPNLLAQAEWVARRVVAGHTEWSGRHHGDRGQLVRLYAVALAALGSAAPGVRLN